MHTPILLQNIQHLNIKVNNHELQFPINQILKDNIEKKFNYTKKIKKIAIKIIRIKIVTKNKFYI